MKKILFLSITVLGQIALIAQAQNKVSEKNIESGWGNLNYAVPESPAFKILDASPSNIMRPTSTRDIAITVGSYYLRNGGTIPSNIAVEISPSLFNPRVSLSKYRENRIWYTSSISIGTKTNQDGSYSLAGGLKFKIIDKSDLRTNNELRDFINGLGTRFNDEWVAARDEVYSDFTDLGMVGVNQALADTTNQNYSKVVAAVHKKMIARVNLKEISNFRDKIKKKLWNAEIWDVGLAGLFSSKDSLIENVNGPNKLGLWTTYGLPLFSQSGQLLIGSNAKLADDKFKKLKQFEVSIGSRLYYGSNNLKGYLELESYFKSSTPNVQKGSLGIETTIGSGIWLSFALGFTKTGDASAQFTPAFNIFFAQPERK